MRKLPGIVLLFCLSACRPPVKPEPRPFNTDSPGGRPGHEDTIPSIATEPVWRDQIRHTAIQSPDTATHPCPSRDGKFFVYVSTEFGAHLQVAMRETNGVVATQLTSNGGDNLFPRISPDGKLLAFASNKDGNWDIYVTRIDAPSAVSQVTFEPNDDVAPSWDPDGKRLVYCTKSNVGIWQIVIVDVATRVKTYLGAGLYPDWSSDKKDPWICFQSQARTANGRSGIWIVRPDGSSLREIAGDKIREWSAINPRFSPDGRWIAYATVKKSAESRVFGAPDEADDIWLVRPDGRMDTRLTDDLSPEWWPSWGGNRIFFVSRREGGQNIYSVAPKPLEDDK